jgi:hypothetical protein
VISKGFQPVHTPLQQPWLILVQYIRIKFKPLNLTNSSLKLPPIDLGSELSDDDPVPILQMLFVEGVSLEYFKWNKQPVMILRPGQVKVHGFPHVLFLLASFVQVQP